MTALERRVTWMGQLPAPASPELAEQIASVGGPCHVGWVPRGLDSPVVTALVSSALPVQQHHILHGGERWHGYLDGYGSWVVAIERAGHCSPVWWSCAAGQALWLEITDVLGAAHENDGHVFAVAEQTPIRPVMSGESRHRLADVG